MTTLLIGHRGTGKSAFLESLKVYARANSLSAVFYDLDKEIESRGGRTIAQLFADGETVFRVAEKKTFAALMAEEGSHKIIALGAGFEGPMPKEARVLWLRRESDGSGRSFLGRPRLNPSLTPHAEYMHRYHIREHRFKAWAHEQLVLPEGYAGGLEDFVLKSHAIFLPFDFTLLPAHFRGGDAFIEKRKTWGTRRWELRDDILTDVQLSRANELLPTEKILYSVRTEPGRITPGYTDWALELGPPPAPVQILSLHERDGTLANSFKKFGSLRAEIYKLAVNIDSFEELELGHDWWLRDPQKRAFLPRSKDGRWRWYRSLFGARMPVHFYREDEGSAADQPLYWQMRLQPELNHHFAAVLGSPVGHSRSPVEHFDFFKERGMPFVAIPVNEDEFAVAFSFLRKLGLTHAAVTAPLKKAAFQICDSLTPEAQELNAVNTLRVSHETIQGHNTDVLALKEIAAEFAATPGEVWLWGGGGVRSSVRAAFPDLKEFSARTGLPRAGSENFGQAKVLIWAAGRARDFRFPGEEVGAGLVLDLNYADDSPGLEWAVMRNLPYQSGLKMFKLQAGFQRTFWLNEKT